MSPETPENGSKTSLNLHFTSLSSPSDRPFWPIFEVFGLRDAFGEKKHVGFAIEP